LKILVINSLDARYGSTYRLRALARLLETSGFEVTVSEHQGSAWQKLAASLRASLGSYDLVLTEKFNPITMAAMAVARLRRRPVVADWDDFDPGLQGSAAKRWLSSFCEVLGPRMASVLTMHSDPIEKRGRKIGKPCLRVPQGYERGLFAPAQDQRRQARARFGLPDNVPIVGHLCTFTHGGALDLETILSAWAAMRQKSVRFLLVGGGPQESRIHEAVGRKGLNSRVTLTGLLPHDQIPAALAAMDASVVFMRNTDANRARVSFKVIESLAMGVPVVGKVVGESQRLFAPYVVDADEKTLPLKVEEVLLRPPIIDAAKIAELFDWQRASAPLQAAVRLALGKS